MDGGCNKDTLYDRIKELTKSKIITKEEKNTLIEIKHVRDVFAHSINSIKKIKYKNFPLEVSFGARGQARESQVKHFFFDDALNVTNKLINTFNKCQADQIDKKKFIEGAQTIRKQYLTIFFKRITQQRIKNS